ncbi:hypothetical protein ERICIV_03437 [Paenibacillus larvae subsp. larvae]|uniref:Uncharacterized protein n=1 Tax=Paenibacillus larvae subsp. larvae TaxID=147375 RepID=A0A2L1U4D1_9BACL|nr:DUF6148 family protein [Paenibacillus larvae]AQT84161.1 hypothetical protein B1222_06785 [Paenibacillus larvae subsp. pulvifaciens]AQZ46141.1 hypothetical protein B5S25_05425 [Paenibacillus larvae subsp. pulvifaciens]AVF27803.1 hypothetical protein ERICIII_03694 [Paenibacillus larvae subsp. larvae]AVF32306.1 hypothetical protein ERICIV_03437 [Paenibacillus larvae subsp. larvae]MBH0342720.1 hypothetical protein [Paenibacillus larvae]
MWTLQEAQTYLRTWIEAEMAVASAQSYTIAGRSLTRAHLAEIRKQIQFWQNEIVKLNNPQRRSRIFRGIPMDI